MDPEPNLNPDPDTLGMNLWIRIHTKMFRIRNTGSKNATHPSPDETMWGELQ